MKCLPLYFKKRVELRSSYDFSHIITYNQITGEEQSFNDQPSVRYFDNHLLWKNGSGRWHREYGKPAIVHSNGIVEHWINGVKMIK